MSFFSFSQRLVLFTILACGALFAQEFKWASGMTGNVTANAVATDDSGNSYVTGSFKETTTFGNTQITPKNPLYDNIFIAKYDANGNFLWVRQAGPHGGGEHASGTAISVDNSGNCYVTGAFDDTTTFDTIPLIQLQSRGHSDIFVAKYDANGNFLWVRQAGGGSPFVNSSDRGTGISVDNLGNSYVTGYFRITATFGNTQITSYGESDIFVAKYDASGNFLWVRKAGNPSGFQFYGDSGLAIIVDNTGNSYVTGYFWETATFGTNPVTQITSDGDQDIFVAKYDANGNFLWVKKAGGNSVDRGNSISVDSEGNSFVTGSFNHDATFGDTTITDYGNEDIFVAKYDVNGNFLWVRKAGSGNSADYGNGISVDISGNSYVTGFFAYDATFGDTTITSNGQSRDIFVAKYDSDGNIQWVQKAGSTGDDRGIGITLDASGNIYATGSVSQNALFGNILVENGGSFITRIKQWELPTVVTPVSPSNNEFNVNVHPTFVWHKVSSAQGYRLEVASNSNFTTMIYRDTLLTDTIHVKAGSSLMHNRKYYWRVQSYNIRGVSAYSPTWTFTTKKQSIATPTNLNALSQVVRNVALSWSDNSTNEAGFIIYRKTGDSLNLSQPVVLDTVGTGITQFNDTTVADTTMYTYRIVAYNADTLSTPSNYAQIYTVTGIKELSGEIPTQFSLAQNYPNPFNPSTLIRFSLPVSGSVVIKVYNSLGETVQTLVNEFRNAGTHEVSFNASGLPSGFYLYEIKSGDYSAVRKMLLLK